MGVLYEPEPNTGCWLWLLCDEGRGYGAVGMGKHRSDYRRRLAHRVMWEIFNGPIQGGLCVLHKCDQPSCVNPAHLFLGTQEDNMKDMARKGRSPSGKSHHRRAAKLTPEEVRGIRFLCSKRIPHRIVADAYGVGTSTVGAIHTRTTWGWLS